MIFPDYFETTFEKKPSEVGLCCANNSVYSLSDQACISLDSDHSRHPFTACGPLNNTTIKFVKVRDYREWGWQALAHIYFWDLQREMWILQDMTF